MNFSNYYTYLKRYKCFLIVFKFMHYILFLFVTTWQNQFVTDRVYPKSDLHNASSTWPFHSLPIFFYIIFENFLKFHSAIDVPHFEKSIYYNKKNWQKNEKPCSLCLKLISPWPKPRNPEVYQICHFFRLQFQYIHVFISNFLLQADFDYWDPFKG